jgi:hypothetical protein
MSIIASGKLDLYHTHSYYFQDQRELYEEKAVLLALYADTNQSICMCVCFSPHTALKSFTKDTNLYFRGSKW